MAAPTRIDNRPRHTVADETLIDAPVDAVRAVILDVEGWTRLHPPAIHAEVLDEDESGRLIQYWSRAGENTVRTWRTRQREGDEITFTHAPAQGAFASVRGGWTFEQRPGGSTLVRMWHDFELVAEDAGKPEQMAASMHRGATEFLRTLKRGVENAASLTSRTVAYKEKLHIAGAVEDVYDFLADATARPEWMRVCLPHKAIVYKQGQPSDAIETQAGEWRFTAVPDGVVVTARHAATFHRHATDDGTFGAQVREFSRQAKRHVEGA